MTKIYRVTVSQHLLPLSPLSILSKQPSAALDLQEAEHKQLDEKVVLFRRENADEIAFATQLLKKARNQTTLHAHLHGHQLIYTDNITQDSIALKHTYLKINGRIYVKIERGHMVGAGGFNNVKYCLDLKKNKIVVLRVSKKPTTQNIPKENRKKRNPFKLIPTKADNPDPTDVTLTLSNDIKLIFDAKSKQIFPDADVSLTCPVKEFQVMEYLGIDLFTLISIKMATPEESRLADCNKKLLKEFCKIPYLMICETLNFHEGKYFRGGEKRVHCDIKAENFAVKIENDCITMTLIDYDYSLKIDGNGKSDPFPSIRGTPDNFAPELVRHITSPKNDMVEVVKARGNVRFIPEEVSLKKSIDSNGKLYGGYYYTTQSDVFALAIELFAVAEKLFSMLIHVPQIYSMRIIALSKLMRFYHPHARPSLPMMKLVFFYIFWRYTEKPFCVDTKENFAAALSAEKLPPISHERTEEITKCLLALSNVVDHRSPTHWKVVSIINREIEKMDPSSDLTTIQFILDQYQNAKNKHSPHFLPSTNAMTQPQADNILVNVDFHFFNWTGEKTFKDIKTIIEDILYPVPTASTATAGLF